MEQSSQFQPKEAICRVCGTAIGDKARICDDCLTPHHHDCWEYNGGCATYACPSGHHKPRPLQVANATAAASPGKPIDKIPFPSLQAGTFLGLFFVTYPTAALTIFAEIMGLINMGVNPPMALFWFTIMVMAILWAAFTAEVYNIDIKNNCITRSKLFHGNELLEWTICSLAAVESIQLIRCIEEEQPRRKLVCRLKEDSPFKKRSFDLTPSYAPGSADDFAIDELLYRIESGSTVEVLVARSLQKLRAGESIDPEEAEAEMEFIEESESQTTE